MTPARRRERRGLHGEEVRPDPDARGVTFLVPVLNGARWLDAVLDSVRAQADGRPMEILVVEDGSNDGSSEILARRERKGGVRVIDGPRRGAAAALNEGLRQAAYPVICQVDQDVVLEPGWMAHLVAELDVPDVAAAQGYYVTPPDAGIWARVMGLDLEGRYRRLRGREVDHVCTGNTAYRASALDEIGGFDETLGYGYDNDASYRLTNVGYHLVFQPRARSTHHWREGWWPYLVQQYGFGYGRLDLVARHRGRLGGDAVSPLPMMLHPLLMATAASLGLVSLVFLLDGRPALPSALLSGGVVGVLGLERFVAGVRAARAFGDRAGFWFAPVHLLRDLAWVAAMSAWCVRRLSGVAPYPAASMRPRPAAPPAPAGSTRVDAVRRSGGT